ncbi:TPA: XkdX family protein [Clostridium sporogenes]
MSFWLMAYNLGWIDSNKEKAAEKLRLAVRTGQNQFGEISPEEYETITGKEFV